MNNDLAGNIVDPDGGTNYAKKKANVHPTLEKTFPTTGFQTDLSILPRLRYANIMEIPHRRCLTKEADST